MLVRVYAPEERGTVALVANDDWLRLWCNGELTLDQPLSFPPLVPVPLRSSAGWNTLLAKVTNWEGPASLKLKLSDNFEEITQNFVALARQEGLVGADGGFARTNLLSRAASRHWDNRAEPLAALVANATTSTSG